MRFGGFVWSLIPSLLVSLPLTSAQAADQIDCPDTSLTSYLVAIIDLLYSNGLTTYEQLLASLSESDSGYQLLQSWYSDQTITLLVPTDSAFQAAGIAPPFDTLGEEEITDLVALHTLVGTWSYDHLPGTPEHGIASTFMSVKGHMNVTNVNTNASQVMVMQQGDQSAVTIRMPTGNTTNWGWQIDTSNTELWNVVILPIGEIVPFPPKLSDALTIPTTSRSTSGLPVLAKALGSAGGAQQLEALTEKGFTIFAPVDDAWTTEVNTTMGNTDLAVKILGNHYTTSYSLYSAAWDDSGTFPSLPVVSGESLSVTSNSSGAWVSMGGVSAMILRSDVTLENGVLHIIDNVLVDPASLTAASTTSGAVPSENSGLPTMGTGQSGTIGPTGSSGTVDEASVSGDASRRFGMGLSGFGGVLGLVMGLVSLVVGWL